MIRLTRHYYANYHRHVNILVNDKQVIIFNTENPPQEHTLTLNSKKRAVQTYKKLVSIDPGMADLGGNVVDDLLLRFSIDSYFD